MGIAVSIIIPFYCTPEKLFNRCMESILAARMESVEVIVVDDGSPKDYYHILEAYINEPTVRVIHTSNAGVSSARNRGIDEAKGKWIMFVDSDDYLNTETLKKVIQFAEDNSGDIVIFNGGGDYNGIIRYNTTFLREGKNYAEEKKDRISLMESALAVGKIPSGYIQCYTLGAPYSKLLRTDFLRQNHLKFDTNVRLAEDALFSLYLYQNAKDICFLNWNLYYYVNNPKSATRKFRPGFSNDMDVFFERVRQFMKQYHLEEELKRAYYIRAQFEINRCILLEYFHLENQDPDAKKQFNHFIRQETYQKALQSDYLINKTFMNRVRLFLIRNKGIGWIQFLKRCSQIFIV